MAGQTDIEWADATFNPVRGCTKVSPGCSRCYAETHENRFGAVKWGQNGTRVITSDSYWKQPLKWNREAEQFKSWSNWKRPRVFCASLSDVFEDWQGFISDANGNVLLKPMLGGSGDWMACSEERANDEFHLWPHVTMDDVRKRLFALIDATPNLDWLLLTKRPENVRKMLHGSIPKLATALGKEAGTPDANIWHRHNLWLGTSIENQEYANKRIPELLKCRDLSPVLFLSCEPLLGPVDLRSLRIGAEFDKTGLPWFDALDGTSFNCDDIGKGYPSVDWVIAGGESGPNARPMHPDWARSLRDQCEAAGTAYFFKQWGEWVPFATTAFPFTSEKREGGECGGPSVLHDFKFKDGVQTCLAGYGSQNKVLQNKRHELRQLDEPWGVGKHTQTVVKVGSKKAGRLLDGKVHDAFPVVK